MTSKNKDCEDVYYEVEAINDNEYIFHVIANAEWLNDEGRLFPVTIDPQIVTNETLIKKFVSSTESNYIYTDCVGEKHTFKQLYYYLTSTNTKVYVSRTDVTIDLHEKLTCVDNKGKLQEVFTE